MESIVEAACLLLSLVACAIAACVVDGCNEADSWRKHDLQMAYLMGYEDALYHRRPDMEKVTHDVA